MSKLKIPETWAEVDFEAIAIDPKEGFRRGPFGSALKKSFFVPTGIKVYEQKHAIKKDHSLGTYFVSLKKFEELKSFEVNPGDYIVSCSGTLGRIYRIPEDAQRGIINQALLRLKINHNVILPNFFESFFESEAFQNELIDAAPGSAQVNMAGLPVIKKLKVPIPPLDEQKRIVAKIESTQEKVKTIESSISKAEELIEKYRESLLQKAFRGDLVPQDPNDEPASKLIERIRNERAKQSDGKKKKKDELPPIKPEEIPFEIPKSWEWVRLADITTQLGDGLHGTPQYSQNGEYFFINGNNFVDGKIVIKETTKRISKSEYIKHKKPLTDRTIFVSINGTIGNVAFYNSEPVILGKSACYFNLDKEIEKKYISLVLVSPYFLNYALGEATGSTIKNVSLKTMREFLIPLPSVNEQKRLVQKLQSTFQGIKNLLVNVTDLHEIVFNVNSSILSSAFTGNLVNQIPSEGTGHELLEKIKNEFSAEDSHVAKKNRITSPRKGRI